MKILLLHNTRLIKNGEDSVVAAMETILRDRGDEVALLLKDNTSLKTGLKAKLSAFFSGIYSSAAKQEMRQVLEQEKPDVVHAHNLYPFFSPSIFAACREAEVPVFYHCHNFLFTCPTTMHFRDNQVCRKCAGGHEYWCVLHNCRQNMVASVGYAARNAVARQWKLFQGVDSVIVPSGYLKQHHASFGFPENKLRVLPNPVVIPDQPAEPATDGEYAAFIGRLSSEKGLEMLIEAANLAPEVPVRIAGEGPERERLKDRLPKNVQFVGFLGPQERDLFFRKARFMVVPSLWYEPFGLAAAEPMAYGVPVIASNYGGLMDVVQDGVTGYSLDPRSPAAIAEKMKRLWSDHELVRQLGVAARLRATEEFSANVFYDRLMAIYGKVAVTT